MPLINAKVSVPSSTDSQNKIYKVYELNRKARLVLEKNFSYITIEGELSGITRPRSGHLYFRLKDEQAQIQCACFRNKAMHIDFDLQEGMAVEVRANVSLYEARGDYQLIVESIQPAGIGDLQIQFEKLKQKLAAAGIFDPDRKKPIPYLPKAIGIITSPSAAAQQDILTTLKRRFPAIPLFLYPTQVQGSQAAAEIAKQIQLANQHKQCDVLILARGGGSLEDLWSFNEEAVAMAIYHSQLPIVSGVGHEIDITLADLCADIRAATPTAAAETVTPRMDELLIRLSELKNAMTNAVQNQLMTQKHFLAHLQKRLRHPLDLINQKYLLIEALSNRLHNAIEKQHYKHQSKLQGLQHRLIQNSPANRLQESNLKLHTLSARLRPAILNQFNTHQQKFQQLCATLQATSPLATLNRGYSLAFDENKKLITNSAMVTQDQTLWLNLKKGQLHCRVIGKNND